MTVQIPVLRLAAIFALGVIVGAAVERGHAASRVALGLNCGVDAARVYNVEDASHAAKACAVVEIHNLPKLGD